MEAVLRGTRSASRDPRQHPDSTTSSNGQDAAPAKKPARRRVTRTAAAPGIPDTTAEATSPPRSPCPRAEAAQDAAVSRPAPEGSLGIELPSAEAAPRRSRRVVRATTTPAVATAPTRPRREGHRPARRRARGEADREDAGHRGVGRPAVQESPVDAPRRGGKRGAAARAAAEAPPSMCCRSWACAPPGSRRHRSRSRRVLAAAASLPPSLPPRRLSPRPLPTSSLP
ncbi:hypothetical protein NKG05_02405 [Oerskovia sp. M15]